MIINKLHEFSGLQEVGSDINLDSTNLIIVLFSTVLLYHFMRAVHQPSTMVSLLLFTFALLGRGLALNEEIFPGYGVSYTKLAKLSQGVAAYEVYANIPVMNLTRKFPVLSTPLLANKCKGALARDEEVHAICNYLWPMLQKYRLQIFRKQFAIYDKIQNGLSDLWPDLQIDMQKPVIPVSSTERTSLRRQSTRVQMDALRRQLEKGGIQSDFVSTWPALKSNGPAAPQVRIQDRDDLDTVKIPKENLC
jgi:hypothetical protein